MKPRLIAKVAAIALAGGAAWLSERCACAAPLHASLSRWTANAAKAWVDALGIPAHADGTTVHGIGYSVRVVPACDGLTPALVVAIAALLLRARARTRVLLAVAGAASAFAVNVVRIATTLAIGTRSPPAASVAHEWVFPAAWIALFAYLWHRWLALELDPEAARE